MLSAATAEDLDVEALWVALSEQGIPQGWSPRGTARYSFAYESETGFKGLGITAPTGGRACTLSVDFDVSESVRGDISTDGSCSEGLIEKFSENLPAWLVAHFSNRYFAKLIKNPRLERGSDKLKFRFDLDCDNLKGSELSMCLSSEGEAVIVKRTTLTSETYSLESIRYFLTRPSRRNLISVKRRDVAFEFIVGETPPEVQSETGESFHQYANRRTQIEESSFLASSGTAKTVFSFEKIQFVRRVPSEIPQTADNATGSSLGNELSRQIMFSSDAIDGPESYELFRRHILSSLIDREVWGDVD
jgi:hypothetical protein